MAKKKKKPADTSWLASVQWSAKTPKDLRSAAETDSVRFATLYAKRLSSRDNETAFDTNGIASVTKSSPYLLGTTALSEAAAPSFEQLGALHKLNGKPNGTFSNDRLSRWLSELPTESDPATAGETLDLLAWCKALPRLASRATEQQLLSLLQRIHDSVNAVSPRQLGSKKAESKPKNRGELEAVLQAELLATVAILIPEWADAGKLRARSAKIIEKTLKQLTDSKGVPDARVLPVLPVLIASLLRCADLARRDDETTWDRETEERLRNLLLQARRLIRPDGTLPLAPSEIGSKTRSVIANQHKGALRTLIDRFLRASDTGEGPAAGLRKEHPAVVSEASRLAVLRSGWSSKADWLGMAWDRDFPDLELLCAAKAVLAGTWKLKIKVDGRRLRVVEPPRQTCWLSDANVDYLELRSEFEDDVVVERHVLLARDDGFAVLADAVLAPRGARIDVKATLPLAPGVRWKRDRNTRGGWLQGKQRRASVAPLWLPCSKIESTAGSLEEKKGKLELRASAPGPRFFMPLLLDWGHRSARTPSQWRRLTVAENRQIVPGDLATGYHFRRGNHQLLFYRSLGPCATRSLLGHQTRNQFVVGRFDREGNVEAMLQVE